MPDYLENPRRVPRERVHCRARVFLASGIIEATTEDIGSRGCRIVVPAPVQRGEVVGLALNAPRYDATLRVDGRIAWVSSSAPWQVGIAYAVLALPGAARWMEGLRKAVPELFPVGRRTQDRLPVDAMVYLGPPPRQAEFEEDQLIVLRTVGAGARVGELRTTLSRTWPRMQRALFALLGQGYITLSRAVAAHPIAWKDVLGAADAAARPEGATLGDGPVSTSSPTPSPSAASTTASMPRPGRPISRRMSEAFEPPVATPSAPITIVGPPARPTPAPARPTSAPTLRAATPAPTRAPASTAPVTRPALPRLDTPAPTRSAPTPAPGHGGAGVGWQGQARPRPPDAEALYQLALAELQVHHTHGALALLRRALAITPGDPDIATAIGRAMRGE